MSEAGRLAALAHALCHRERLSPQAAWRVLGESYAIDCSLSEVEDALEASECDHCPTEVAGPALKPASAAAVHQQASGWLTSSLEDDAYG